MFIITQNSNLPVLLLFHESLSSGERGLIPSHKWYHARICELYWVEIKVQFNPSLRRSLLVNDTHSHQYFLFVFWFWTDDRTSELISCIVPDDGNWWLHDLAFLITVIDRLPLKRSITSHLLPLCGLAHIVAMSSEEEGSLVKLLHYIWLMDTAE